MACTVPDILNFLKEFKIKVSAGEMNFIPRKINIDSLAALGMTIQDAENLILSLTEKEYCKGPESDNNGSSGNIWVFGAAIETDLIYIKLKLDLDEAKCLSFHIANFSMQFPHQNSGS